MIRPTFPPRESASVITTFNRRINDYKLALVADDMSRMNWQAMYKLDDCHLQTDFFYQELLSVINFHAPLEACTFKTNDRPWVTTYFKNLILQRNLAFNNRQHVLYRLLKNKVNRVRKSLQKQYYLDHIENLKTTKPAQWWKELKSICRFNTKNNAVFDDNLTHFGETVSAARLPDVINTFLCLLERN